MAHHPDPLQRATHCFKRCCTIIPRILASDQDTDWAMNQRNGKASPLLCRAVPECITIHGYARHAHKYHNVRAWGIVRSCSGDLRPQRLLTSCPEGDGGEGFQGQALSLAAVGVVHSLYTKHAG